MAVKATLTLLYDPEIGVGLRLEGGSEETAELMLLAALAQVQRQLQAKAIVNRREHGIVGARTLPPLS